MDCQLHGDLSVYRFVQDFRANTSCVSDVVLSCLLIIIYIISIAGMMFRARLSCMYTCNDANTRVGTYHQNSSAGSFSGSKGM